MFYLYCILTISWFIFMTWLSHQDGEHTNKTSSELAKKLAFLDSDLDALNMKLRKAAHTFSFLIFVILLGMTLKAGSLPMRFLLFSALWSYIDEATKPWIHGRHFSWIDVGLNLLGVAIGCMVLLTFRGLSL